MPRISSRIAYPIIVSGLFIIVAFMALNYQNLNIDFYIMLPLLAIYVFFFGVAIGQNVSSPIRKLLKKAEDLSNGDFKSRLYLENKDEIGELARVFNKIANELEESKSATEKSERSVGIKVEAKTQALEETINALEQKVKNRTMELTKMVSDLENFQTQSKQKEAEAEKLKSQMMDLQKELEERSVKKRTPKKVKEVEP